MSELFEELPEVGDPDKLKLVFFFDEAHLLFKDAPKALLEKVEQVVRLIRSKAVGIYFVTQNPAGHSRHRIAPARPPHSTCAARFQPAGAEGGQGGGHNLPRQSRLRHRKGDHGTRYRRGAGLDPRREGPPTMVQKTLVKPPNSRVGPITDSERKAVISASPVKGVYDEVEDRESAYEILQKRTASHAHAEAQSSGDDQGTKGKAAGGTSGSDGFWATFGKTIVRSVVSGGDPHARAVAQEQRQARHARGHQPRQKRRQLLILVLDCDRQSVSCSARARASPRREPS